MNQTMQQKLDNKSESSSELKQENTKSPSPEESTSKEPVRQDYVSHLFSQAAAVGESGTPSERFSSFLTSPIISHPVNETPRNQTFIQMQQTFGNDYVQRMVEKSKTSGHNSAATIQPKLKIGQPNDKYEQEADRVADQVMRMPEPKGSFVNGNLPLVQRKSTCPECEEKKEEDEEKFLQTKEIRGNTPGVTPYIAASINSIRGGGQPLPKSIRNYFEPRYGQDFSGVRVHNDAIAANTSKQINARAFTIGQNIGFGANQYSPETNDGRKLIAHELTHTLQQQHLQAALPYHVLQRKLSEQQFKEIAKTPGALSAEFITAEEFERQTGFSANILPEIPPSEKTFLDITGLPPDTVPPGLLSPSPFLESKTGDVDQSASNDKQKSQSMPNQVILPQALGIPLVLANYPTFLIPKNARGIMWTPGGLGHLSIFAKAKGKLTIRGFRGTYLDHLIKTKDMLRIGIPGGLRDDILLTKMGNQTIVYRASNAKAAARFAETIISEVPNYRQKYSIPPKTVSPGKTVVCGNNCITAPAPLISEALGIPLEIITPRGPIDITKFGGPEGGPYERLKAGRGATVRDWLNQPDKYFEDRGLKRVRVPKVVKYVKVGGGILMIYGAAASGRRIYKAWGTKEFIPVVIEETGSWGGGAAGAALGAKICAPAGAYALLCAAGGGILGGLAGSKFGRNVGGSFRTIMDSPYLLAEFLKGTVKAFEVLENMMGSFVHGMIFGPLMKSYASLNPKNWDLRYMPPILVEDIKLLQQAFLTQFQPSNPDEMLEQLSARQTMRDYDLPSTLIERIATKMTQFDQDVDPTSPGFMAEDLLNLSPMEFVNFLTEWNLHFIQDPKYIAGYTGRWDRDNTGVLDSHLRPLIRKRAEINPHNWKLEHISEIDIVDQATGEKITKDPGIDILALGQIVWEYLGQLDEKTFREESRQPLSIYSIPQDLIDDIALEIEYFAQAAHPQGVFTGILFAPIHIPGEELRNIFTELTPVDFVQFLLKYGVPLIFKQEPASIARIALAWVREGYQAW